MRVLPDGVHFIPVCLKNSNDHPGHLNHLHFHHSPLTRGYAQIGSYNHILQGQNPSLIIMLSITT